jgi:phospholipid transport system substrate-binding protein
MKKWTFRLLGLISFSGLILFSTASLADDLSEIDLFMKDKLSTVMGVLENKSLTKVQRDAEVLSEINDAFDFKRMAMLSLGRKYWPKLSKGDKSRFTTLFIKRIKASYLEKLDLYTDEEIDYSAPVRVRKKVHMLTELVSGDNRISMRYKLYKSKTSGWRVYDIELEGVSIITTYRSQFHEVLNKGTMSDLMEKLERSDGM